VHVGKDKEAAVGTSGSAGTCTLAGGGALFIGETYDLFATAPGAPKVRVTVEAGTGAQRAPALEVQKLRQWYDAREVRSIDGEEISAEADKLHAALRGSRQDYKAVVAALGSLSAEKLQAVKVKYHEKHGKQLGDELHAHRSKFKGTVTKIELLLIRSKPELDAATAHGALEARDPGPLIEMLCTSLPTSLIELREAYREMYKSEVEDTIKKTIETTASSSSSASPLPLLLALLEGASEAQGLSTASAVQADLAELRAALSGSEVDVPRLVRVFGRRTRAHLRIVASAHGSLKEELKKRLSGDLQRAVLMLIQRSEEYYARKLHAAFFGLRKTPELSPTKSLGTLTKRDSLLERVQSNWGVMTHDDTVISVIAARQGRDLSGIAHAFETFYKKELAETIVSQTHGDLSALLSNVVRNAPAYSNENNEAY